MATQRHPTVYMGIGAGSALVIGVFYQFVLTPLNNQDIRLQREIDKFNAEHIRRETDVEIIKRIDEHLKALDERVSQRLTKDAFDAWRGERDRLEALERMPQR